MKTWKTADGSGLPTELAATLARDDERLRKANLTEEEHEAVQRLVGHARRDSGQSRRVANFLLAWFDAEAHGGFDPTDLWCLDYEIEDDVVAVLEMIRRTRKRPHSVGYGQAFERLVALWRTPQ